MCNIGNLGYKIAHLELYDNEHERELSKKEERH